MAEEVDGAPTRCAVKFYTSDRLTRTACYSRVVKEEVNMCKKCGGTGVIETGNNDLPCDCPAGKTALFNQAGVVGPVTGEEVTKHFLNSSPDPIEPDGNSILLAENLPGRR